MSHPDDLPKLTSSIEHSAASLEPWKCDFRLVRANGERIKWIRASSIPHKLDDGSVAWDGVIVDITSEQETLQRLSLHEQLLGQRRPISDCHRHGRQCNLLEQSRRGDLRL